MSALHDRVLRLRLLGFEKAEIGPILAREFEREIPASELDEVWGRIDERLAEQPQVRQLKTLLGLSWARQDMMLSDLLAVYQLMVKNFNAMAEGLKEHPDGTPVIAVRATELAAVADRIMKIDQERVASTVAALRMLPELEGAPAGPKALEDGEVVDAVVTPVAQLYDE